MKRFELMSLPLPISRIDAGSGVVNLSFYRVKERCLVLHLLVFLDIRCSPPMVHPLVVTREI